MVLTREYSFEVETESGLQIEARTPSRLAAARLGVGLRDAGRLQAVQAFPCWTGQRQMFLLLDRGRAHSPRPLSVLRRTCDALQRRTHCCL